MKKYILPTLIALSALSVSASAGLYSITGLSELFVGASLAVIIMAASLEISKLVIASFLYQYWSIVNKALKLYLSIALGILILITSAGIYGFLSNAYQETANKIGVVDKETQVYKVKKDRFQTQLENTQNEKLILSNDITELRKALSNNSTTQYVDKKTGQLVNVSNSRNRKTFETQLNSAIENKDKLDAKIISSMDSITSLDMKILDIESKTELAGELGPLKYISKLTGYPMDKIINWFILLIILVFDPLAISLVIAANFAFNQIKTPTQQITVNPTTPNPPPTPTQQPEQKSRYNYIPPIFRKKKKDNSNIKTY
jgi:hypothetical protein